MSVAAQSVPIDAALDGVREVQFETADVLRRAQGHTLQAVGFGPEECPYRVVASGPFWVLRDYGEYSATQWCSDCRSANQASVHLGTWLLRRAQSATV